MCDWQELRISELATIDIGGTPSRAIPAFWADKPGGHPWISIADLKGKYVSETKEHITALGVRSSNVKLIPKNTTVMSFKLTVGRTAIAGNEMFCNEAIAIFQPKDDRLHGPWLYHALPRAATSVVTDTAVKGATLNKAKMAEMTLNLPPPREQIKIAQVLDTLDTAIHETEAIIAKLKAVKQGLLHDLLTRGIDANGELRPPQAEAPHLYKPSPLGWIPKEWDVGNVANMADILDNQRVPVNEAERSKRPGDVPYYGANGQQGWIDRPLFNEPLILLAEDGGNFDDFASRPIAYRVNGPSWVNNHAHILKAKLSCSQAFIFFALVHRDIRRYISGGTRTKLTAKELKSIELPYPPQNEQEEIAQRLETIEAQLGSELQFKEKLIREKSGLMDDLLTGRVRVTPLLQEPQPA